MECSCCMTDVLLQDDSNGQGPYIKTWNVSGVAKPTDEQLNAVDSAADLEETKCVRATRKTPTVIWLQLDMRSDNVNGTTTWKDHVASVKTANPIPTVRRLTIGLRWKSSLNRSVSKHPG